MDRPGIYSVDAGSGEFSFDTCDKSVFADVEQLQGRVTLTEEQLDEVRGFVNQLRPATSSACGFDKPELTLDLLTSSKTYLLQDDFYACRPLGRTFVGQIDGLANFLFDLARTASRPPPQKITVVSVGGVAGDATVEGDSTCDQNLYARTSSVDLDASELTWDFCKAAAGTNVYRIVHGRRGLGVAEAADLLNAYSNLEPVYVTECVLDKPNIDVTVETSKGTLHYVDEASCDEIPQGARPVKNIDALAQEFSLLVGDPVNESGAGD